MQYQGGKFRVAKELAGVINEISRRQAEVSQANFTNDVEHFGGGRTTLVSLFCGACSVEFQCAKSFKQIICNDNNRYLMACLKAVQDGWVPPTTVSKEQYTYTREHKDEDPALTGFIGFGCSFGGKFFGGYAGIDVRNGRKYADSSSRALVRDITPLNNVTFICMDYREVEIPDGCVIYADPPYDGTTQYNNTTFNTKEFWEYARVVSQDHLMFISEQSAPEDFVSVWHKDLLRMIDYNKDNYFTVREHLFLHKKWCK